MHRVEPNPYLTTVPLDRVVVDAKHGVSLACQAWRVRDPAAAARVLGAVIEAIRPADREREQGERQRRVIGAMQDYYGKGRPANRRGRNNRKNRHQETQP